MLLRSKERRVLYDMCLLCARPRVLFLDPRRLLDSALQGRRGEVYGGSSPALLGEVTRCFPEGRSLGSLRYKFAAGPPPCVVDRCATGGTQKCGSAPGGSMLESWRSMGVSYKLETGASTMHPDHASRPSPAARTVGRYTTGGTRTASSTLCPPPPPTAPREHGSAKEAIWVVDRA